jgi:hypothetical protein
MLSDKIKQKIRHYNGILNSEVLIDDENMLEGNSKILNDILPKVEKLESLNKEMLNMLKLLYENCECKLDDCIYKRGNINDCIIADLIEKAKKELK